MGWGVYLSRQEEPFAWFTFTAYAKLEKLVRAAGVGTPEFVDSSSAGGGPPHIRHWDAASATALSDAIERLLPDIPDLPTENAGSPFASLLDYWSGGRNVLTAVMHFARRGPFVARIED